MSKQRKNVTRKELLIMSNTKMNFRVNSYLLSTFGYIGKNKYDMKSVSKFLKNRLHFYSDILSSNKDMSYDLATLGLSGHTLDKSYTISFQDGDLSCLKNISSRLGLSDAECLRKIITFECSVWLNFFPQPKIDVSHGRKSTSTYTKFRFRCDDEKIKTFMDVYSGLTGENSITSALNDLIKEIILEVKGENKQYILELVQQPTFCLKNDFKFNFTISNKRFDDFTYICSEIGITPQECLRKKIASYVANSCNVKK